MARLSTVIRQTLTHPIFLAGFALALIALAAVFVIDKNHRQIYSDGWGYYLHLPAVFVFGDPDLSFLNDSDLPGSVTQYRFNDGSWQGLRATDVGYRDKYALGPAVMQLPFFLAALAIAKLTLPNVTGFEAPFQLANGISGIFYFALGAYLTYRAARLRSDVIAVVLALAFAAFATNLLFYASFDGSYSHVYGFCLVAGIVFLTVRRADNTNAPPRWEFALFGLLMGLAIMVRPTNAVVGLLYLVFVRRSNFRTIITGSMLAFVASIVGALPQMLLWLTTTAQLIYYSYEGEGFRFRSPELRNYLVSIRKGVFFWHPAYLLMILAAFAQVPARRFEGLIVLAILGLNLYIGASWGDYTFGDSFGCRQIVEMIPVLIPPTAAAIGWILSSRWRVAAASVAAVLIVLNSIYFYGYLVGTLPHNNATRVSYLQFWTNPLGL
jgi:hypothetical protein